jgi:hypothetical protein
LLFGLKNFRENGGYVKIGKVYDNFKLPIKLENRSGSIFDWQSFCLVLNMGDSSVHISVNGEWLKINFDVKFIKSFQVSLEPFITVGKYIGKMTDLNVWSEALSEQSTKDFSTGVYFLFILKIAVAFYISENLIVKIINVKM